MPPREQEELVDSFREDFGEVEVRAFSLETAMTLDDDADSEDVEAAWNRASNAASSSSAAASAGWSHPDERPPKRGALEQLTEDSCTAVPAANETLMPPPWDPQGKPVLDSERSECSHYR